MTLPKAIRILENLVLHHRDKTYHDDEDALKLGIAALKAVIFSRKPLTYWPIPLLPGETEEKED